MIVQQRQNIVQLDLRCGAYRVRLMSPRLVSDDWARWLADPRIMLPRGVKPRNVSRQQLGQYVMRMHANQRAVIGIFDAESDRHLGVLEMTVDRKHLIAMVELMVDTQRESLAQVAGEVLPFLLPRISRKFGLEKYVVQVPETNREAIAFFSTSDWILEAELVDEVPGAGDGSRLTVTQFAWFPPREPVSST
jgi:hypothetical protein